MEKNDKLISLKEAAALSGYSPDYIGQLIRGGKISGKQVFSNVSWMTTEKAVRDYIEKDKKSPAPHTLSLFERVSVGVSSPEVLTTAYIWASWFVIVLCAVFVLLLLYVFSVSIDHAIEQRYLQAIHHA